MDEATISVSLSSICLGNKLHCVKVSKFASEDYTTLSVPFQAIQVAHFTCRFYHLSLGWAVARECVHGRLICQLVRVSPHRQSFWLNLSCKVEWDVSSPNSRENLSGHFIVIPVHYSIDCWNVVKISNRWFFWCEAKGSCHVRSTAEFLIASSVRSITCILTGCCCQEYFLYLKLLLRFMLCCSWKWPTPTSIILSAILAGTR